MNFILDLYFIEFVAGLFFLTLAFLIICYPIGVLFGLILFVVSVFGSLVYIGSSSDTRLFPPSPIYVDQLVTKYKLGDMYYEEPFRVSFSYSTLGFAICSFTGYEGSTCKDYLTYFENKIVKYRDEKLEKEKW